MLKELAKFLIKPELYAPSTSAFWDDPHISEGMLNAHLEPENDASSRSHEFINLLSGFHKLHHLQSTRSCLIWVADPDYMLN